MGDLDYSLEIDDNLKDADILIVDDNVTNCEVLQRRLSQHGLQCRVVYDGENALKEVEKKNSRFNFTRCHTPRYKWFRAIKRI